MKLHNVAPSIHTPRRRKGRGNGSGRGTYCGRGCKGQNSRSGGGVRLGFEGGQTPLLRRLPKKKGFRNPTRVEYHAISLGKLGRHFSGKDEVNTETLTQKGLLSGGLPAKIVGGGECSKDLVIGPEIRTTASAAAHFSAKKKAEKAEVPVKKPAKKAESPPAEET